MPARISFPIVFLGLVILALNPGFARDISSSTVPFNQRVSFVPYPDSREKITNDLLQNIAEGSNRLRTSVGFEFEGHIGLRWDTGENGLQRVSFSLLGVKVSGDVFYRDFSLENVLMPDFIQFNLHVTRPDGSVVFSRVFSDLPVNGQPDFLQLEIPGTQNHIELVASLEEIQLGYGELAYQRLDAWFGYLKDYYEAGLQLQAIEMDIKNLDFSDPSSLILDEFLLCETERKLVSLSQKRFFQNLGLQTRDPERVLVSFQKLFDHTQSLRKDFNDKMEVLDRLLYEKGLSLLASGQNNAAREIFESALMLNPFNVPSHLSLAGLDLARGHKNRAIDRMGKIFSEINPHGEWRKASEVLTDSIMSKFFIEAFNLNREGRFKESLDLLAPLEQFCEDVSGYFDCPHELEFRLNQTHIGMYRSFLVVGNRALRNDNLSLTRTYVSSALEYQQENQRFIPDASEALEVLQLCVYRYGAIAGERFAQGEYLMSSKSLEEALALCSQYPELNCPDGLSQRHQMVLNRLETNRQQPQIDDNPPVGSAVGFSFQNQDRPPEELLGNISQAQFLAWAGKVEEARAMEEKIKMDLEESEFANGEKLVMELERLSNMIREKECELTKREFQSWLKKGFRYLEFSEFRLAYATGKEIQILMEAHSQCGLQGGDSLRKLTGLEPAVNYLDLMEAATIRYSGESLDFYEEFLETYQAAESLFLNQNLNYLGITHMELVSFISFSGNLDLMKAGVLFMAGQVESYVTETVALLWVLKNTGLGANEARSLQEVAGEKLAHYYHSRGTGVKPEVLVHSLTKRDSWFRFFEQAFIRNWNNY